MTFGPTSCPAIVRAASKRPLLKAFSSSAVIDTPIVRGNAIHRAWTACPTPQSRPSLQHASSPGSLDYRCSFCLHRFLSGSSQRSHADSAPIPAPRDNRRCIRSRLRVQYRRRFTPVGDSFCSRSLRNQYCDLWWSYLPVSVPRPLAPQTLLNNTPSPVCHAFRISLACTVEIQAGLQLPPMTPAHAQSGSVLEQHVVFPILVQLETANAI